MSLFPKKALFLFPFSQKIPHHKAKHFLFLESSSFYFDGSERQKEKEKESPWTIWDPKKKESAELKIEVIYIWLISY